MSELPELLVPDAAGWRTWLAEHHAACAGVWLVLHNRGAQAVSIAATRERAAALVDGPVTTLTYALALDEALCFGWIDGQGARRDEGSHLQRFTPRRARSPWSARNVGHVERLRRESRMQPGGEAAFEAARADGRIERAYAGQATMQLQDDLLAAVAADARAQAMFDVLTRTNLFAIYYRVQEAKRPETRSRRIADFVAMLARGDTPHPQKRRPPL